MIRRSAHRLIAVAALAIAGADAPADAQSLDSRVAAVRDGNVRLSFAARPGVCGHGESIDVHDGTSDWERDCDEGPVRVVLTVRDREVTRVKTYVGGRWRPQSDATDLGTVSAPEAAKYLIGLAARLDGRAGKGAILPATLADGATVWPELLRIARDAERPRQTRKAAVFWVGQEAARAATAGIEELAADDAEDVEIRKSAIFALSQRPADEGVPALIRIARTSPSPQLRKSALFWLGQSNDPRALDLFEELLVRN